MKKLFYFTWLLSLLFSLFVLLGATSKEAGRKFIYQEYQEGFSAGDLFDFCLLEDFKGKFRLIKDEEKGTLETADIVTFGDSFFVCNYNSPRFAKELEERKGRLVYNKPFPIHDDLDINPIVFLKSMHYKRGKRKILILETIERHSIKNILALAAPAEDVDGMDEIPTFRNINDWIDKYLITLNNNNKDFDYFLRRNILTYSITKWIADFKFRFLGEIDSRIGAYSMPHKMLFYSGDLSFKSMSTSEKVLNFMATILSEFSKELKQEYNIDLVYVIVPNKYSIYNDFVDEPYFYNNYIPRINEKLRAKGISVIDLYSIYMNYRQNDDSKLLYFPSDTHFSPFGKELLIEAVLKELRNLGCYTPRGQ